MTEETKTEAPAKKAPAKKEAPKPNRVVRFRAPFYDNIHGHFEAGEVYRIPDGVELPTRGIEYIEGAPTGVEASELEEDEKPKRKPAPGGTVKKKK